MRDDRARIGQRAGLHESECFALIDWAERHNKLLALDHVQQFRCVSEGAEHKVAIDPLNNRAIKSTLPSKFGHSPYGEGYAATPLEYLERLAWHNALFGDDIRIVGVIHDESHLEVVSSQPWIKACEPYVRPTQSEIDAYFAAFGFCRVPLNPDAPLFFSAELDLIAADAHDQNVIRDQAGKLCAIDIVIGVPGPRFRRQIAACLEDST